MSRRLDDWEAALTELRQRLEDALARKGLTKTQLAARTGMSRTTVQTAFQRGGPVPSAVTVAVLADKLGLPTEQLLKLRRTATDEAGREQVRDEELGKLIGQWDPHDLEVHPASDVASTGAPARGTLPGYVRRAHDEDLAKAVREAAGGGSRMLVLVGSSSTGKTRACWEAVQPLAAQGWRLWHPYDPTRVEAALEDLRRVQPRTVVWLNEAQHYLGDRAAGERIAAAVHRLLISPDRGPVLVLGTLWPAYAHQYTALPYPGGGDPHSRVRELLSHRTVTIPDFFDAPALAAAAALAEDGDGLLADALTRTHSDGRVTQDLAGAPELLNRYQRATPAAKALLEAAMDARRLGAGLHLPQTFLTDAATDYLSQTDYDQLTDNWAEAAFAELAEPVHGKQAPLRRTTPRPPGRPPTPSTAAAPPSSSLVVPVFRLTDHLEQHGRTTRTHLCPPSSFWHAAHAHLTHPDDLDNLAQAADARHRLQWARHLQYRAARHGSTSALSFLAEMREMAGDHEGADTAARQAAHHGSTYALVRLAEIREMAGDSDGAETLARQAADQGNIDALHRLADIRGRVGNQRGVATLYQHAADHGSTDAIYRLAVLREKAGDRKGAETLLRQAADHGDTDALHLAAMLRTAIGDPQGAEFLYGQAADHGDNNALVRLAEIRESVGDRRGAEILYRQAADQGNTQVMIRLGVQCEQAEDQQGAEAFYRQAADHGSAHALYLLAVLREKAGDLEGGEILHGQAADQGNTYALVRLAEIREEAGDRESAEALARQAAGHGNSAALVRLAEIREMAGHRQCAEILARQAADHGDPRALARLAEIREEAGDPEGAGALARQAADHGDIHSLYRLAVRRGEVGDREGAETLAREAAGHGSTAALVRLAEIREEAGDPEGAGALARQAADHGDTEALYRLAVRRGEVGDREGAETLAREAADHGSTRALYHLAEIREKAGDPRDAETLYLQAADHRDPRAVARIVEIREKAGDREGAEVLARQAADRGRPDAQIRQVEWELTLQRLWPHGLDPDGTPTPPWQ
ncbi:helix-turn-helix domain-containing protein [Streptomyces sp. NPDC015139]|uniref:helix-turn-helix domain-containing protein n=1 Tax=Streptomyces sp. NPDC015139 TaxID=3364942 RepID=UPI0036F71260